MIPFREGVDLDSPDPFDDGQVDGEFALDFHFMAARSSLSADPMVFCLRKSAGYRRPYADETALPESSLCRFAS